MTLPTPNDRDQQRHYNSRHDNTNYGFGADASRNGKVFDSCSTCPKCQYASWNAPIAEHCPTCNCPKLTIKTTKRRGVEKVCPEKNCKYATPYGCDPSDAEGPRREAV